MTKAIFHNIAPYGLQYAKKLVDEHGWEAVYVSTIPSVHEECKKLFPNSILHNFYDSNKCIPADEFKDLVLDPIDPEWLNDFAIHESICMNMMERNDPWGNFQYKDRLRLYHDLIRYWTTVLRKLKPDYFVVIEEPHEVGGYVLSMVGEKLGMKTIMFLRLPFFRMYPVFDYIKGSTLVTNSYQNKLKKYNGEAVVLEDSLEEYLGKIRSTYNINEHLYNQTDELKDILNAESLPKKLLKKFILFVKFFNLLKYPKRIKFVLSLFKPAPDQAAKSFFGNYRTSTRTFLEYQLMIWSTRTKKKKLKVYYDSIANHDPDLNSPFIVFALNFQPERTTSPIGGQFVNALLAIDLIAKNLPKGWKLYVKEHPTQFIHNYLGDPFRSKKYFDDIKAIKNVELIPLIFDNYDLIDKAKAVATVTGTMAFESVIREKPAIIFGHVWFKECEGMMYVDSDSKMKEAMNKIASGYKPVYNKVRLFAQTLQEHSYRSFVGGLTEFLYSNMTQEENAEVHIKAIMDLINSEEK